MRCRGAATAALHSRGLIVAAVVLAAAATQAVAGEGSGTSGNGVIAGSVTTTPSGSGGGDGGPGGSGGSVPAGGGGDVSSGLTPGGGDGATNVLPPPNVGAPAAPAVDPLVLAQSAYGQMPLEVPEVRMAPQPPLKTYVHLETWLWIPQSQWHDVSLTVSAGAVSVTVVARPLRVEWDLTESDTSCRTAGRPWFRGMGDEARTDCSYTYEGTSDAAPGGDYPVSAVIVYHASWTCSGPCSGRAGGDLGEASSFPGEAEVVVAERQSVVTDVS